MFKHIFIALLILVALLLGGGWYVYANRQMLAEKAVTYTVQSVKNAFNPAAQSNANASQSWLGSMVQSGSNDMQKALLDAVMKNGLGALGAAPTQNVKNNASGEDPLAGITQIFGGQTEQGNLAQALLGGLNNVLNNQENDACGDNGHDINARDTKGRTLLINVCRTDVSAKVVKMLIKYGADVNAVDNNGRTALMYVAVYNRDPEVAAVLLEAGAKRKVRDNKGKRAVDYATDEEIYQLLQ